MTGKKYFVMLLFLFLKLTHASISLGTCQLSCEQSEDELTSRSGLQGPQGKRGPVGLPGTPGPPGPSGPPGQCTKCNQLEEENVNLRKLTTALEERLYPTDCVDVKKFANSNGVYVIFPNGGTEHGVQVYCDQVTDDGGWTVIQRRIDGSEDFYRPWDEYVVGFGFKEREFWLGLDTIYKTVANETYSLRFDLTTRTGEKLFAEYSTFRLASATENYRITLTGYTGNAGNSMRIHNGREFTTKDRDNDGCPDDNCAVKYKGAWWYTYGHHANLNGLYDGASSEGMSWYKWKNSWTAFLKTVEMKIRRRN